MGWYGPRVRCPGRFSVIFPEHQIYIVSFAGLVVGTEEILRAKPAVVCLIMSPQ